MSVGKAIHGVRRHMPWIGMPPTEGTQGPPPPPVGQRAPQKPLQRPYVHWSHYAGWAVQIGPRRPEEVPAPTRTILYGVRAWVPQPVYLGRLWWNLLRRPDPEPHPSPGIRVAQRAFVNIPAMLSGREWLQRLPRITEIPSPARDVVVAQRAFVNIPALLSGKGWQQRLPRHTEVPSPVRRVRFGQQIPQSPSLRPGIVLRTLPPRPLVVPLTPRLPVYQRAFVNFPALFSGRVVTCRSHFEALLAPCPYRPRREDGCDAVARQRPDEECSYRRVTDSEPTYRPRPDECR